jgi:hypothetical protein
MILAGSTVEAAQEIALHGSRSDSLPLSQPAPVNAIQVLLKDHLLETLTGPLTRLNARQLLSKTAAAIQAAALAHAQVQDAAPEAPVVVPDHPPAPAFISQTRTVAVGARNRPGIPGRYRKRATASLDVANLELGQT